MQDFAGGAAELYFCKGKVTECPQKYKRKEGLFSAKCTIAWDIYGIYAELYLISLIRSRSNPIRSLVPEQISMDYRWLEDLAGCVENERATKCQQGNERWQEVIFFITVY